MQILPSDYSIQSQDTGAATAASASGNFAGIFQSSLDADDSDPVANFLDSVHSAIDAVNRGEADSVDEAMEDDETSGPLVDAPYSRHTLNGVLYTLDEVTFTTGHFSKYAIAYDPSLLPVPPQRPSYSLPEDDRLQLVLPLTIAGVAVVLLVFLFLLGQLILSGRQDKWRR